MEGCPKTLMISFDTKEPAPADFTQPISSYIQEFFQENPSSYENEIQQINQLRKSVFNVTKDNQGCSSLRRYFAQLHFLQSRFPMGEGGAAAVPFTWYDVYCGEPVTHKDVRFEQACVLFNLGGVYSQLGANESRTTDESMKIACTYFQCAAGAFQYLKSNFMLDSLPDMGGDILLIKASIMLGQAQECLLEKSIRDARKNTLIARIAIQIVEYFQETVKLLESAGAEEMGSTLRRSWSRHLKIKILTYTALAYSYMSNESDQTEKYGEKAAYLKGAVDKMNEAMKLTKNQPTQVLENLKFVTDVVGNKYDGAKKENDFVYHDIVPELEKLPEIKSVSLVKAMPFQYNDRNVSGPDIFQRLIPMKAHEASSLYSEEKAKVLRQINVEIEEKDIKLSETLSSMHIEDLMNPEEEKLPEALIVKCKELQEKGDIVKTVEETITDLAKVTEDIDDIVLNIEGKLQKEEDAEKELKMAGLEYTDSDELDKIKKEFGQWADAHEKARNTNTELCGHYETSKPLIELLLGPQEDILASLPSQNVIDAPIDEPVVQRIREILNKVTKMKSQRKHLETQLRDQLNQDDITGLLVVREDGNREDFFQEQLKKHDDLCCVIRQNLSAQKNILQALLEANAKYAPTRLAAMEIASQREARIQSYMASIIRFQEVGLTLRKGVQFYETLKENVTKLQKKVDEFCSKKDKERAKQGKVLKNEGPPSRPTAPKPQLDSSSKVPFMTGNLPPRSYLPATIPGAIPGDPRMQPPSSLRPAMQMQHLPSGFPQDMRPNFPGPLINRPPISVPGVSSRLQNIPSTTAVWPIVPNSQDPPRPQNVPHPVGDPRAMPPGSGSEFNLPRRDSLHDNKERSNLPSPHSSGISQSPMPPDSFQRPMHPDSHVLQPRIPSSMNLPAAMRMPVSQDGSQIYRTRPGAGQMSTRMQSIPSDQFRPIDPSGQMIPEHAPYSGSFTRPQGMQPNLRMQSVDVRHGLMQHVPEGAINYPIRQQPQQFRGQLPPPGQQRPPIGQQPHPIGQMSSIRGQVQPSPRHTMLPQGPQQHSQEQIQAQFPMRMPVQHGLHDKSVQPQPGHPNFQQNPNLTGKHNQDMRPQSHYIQQQQLQPRVPSPQQQPQQLWRPQHSQGPQYIPAQTPIRPLARPHLPEPLIPERTVLPSSLIAPFGTIPPHVNPPLVPQQRNNPTTMHFTAVQQSRQLEPGFERPLIQPGDHGQCNIAGTTMNPPGGHQHVSPGGISSPQLQAQHPSKGNIQVQPKPPDQDGAIHLPRIQPSLPQQQQNIQPASSSMIQPASSVIQPVSSLIPNLSIRPQITSNTQQRVQQQRYDDVKSMYPQQGFPGTLPKQIPQQYFPQNMGAVHMTSANQLSEDIVNTRVQANDMAPSYRDSRPNTMQPGQHSAASQQPDVSHVRSSPEMRSAQGSSQTQYAFQGPMSSPIIPNSRAETTHPPINDIPKSSIPNHTKPNNLSGYTANDLRALHSQTQRHVPNFNVSSSDLRVYPPNLRPSLPASQNFPPQSPTQIVNPVTLNRKPLMTATATDPSISSILGNQTRPRAQTPNQVPLSSSAETTQIGLQQLQMQQVLLQQQQLIGMLQSQQAQQRSSENNQIDKLQQQMIDQQKLIERLSNEQHKLVEEQHKIVEEQHKFVEGQHKQQTQQQVEQMSKGQHPPTQAISNQTTTDLPNYPSISQLSPSAHRTFQKGPSETKESINIISPHPNLASTPDLLNPSRQENKCLLPDSRKCDDGKHCLTEQKGLFDQQKSQNLSSQPMANTDNFGLEIEGILLNVSHDGNKNDATSYPLSSTASQDDSSSKEPSSIPSRKIKPCYPSIISDSSASNKHVTNSTQSTNQYFPSADSASNTAPNELTSKSTDSSPKISVSKEPDILSSPIIQPQSSVPFYEPMLETEQDKRSAQSTGVSSQSTSVSSQSTSVSSQSTSVSSQSTSVSSQSTSVSSQSTSVTSTIRHEEVLVFDDQTSAIQPKDVISRNEQKLDTFDALQPNLSQSDYVSNGSLPDDILPIQNASETEKINPTEEYRTSEPFTEIESCPGISDSNTCDFSELNNDKTKANDSVIVYKELGALPDYPTVVISDEKPNSNCNTEPSSVLRSKDTTALDSSNTSSDVNNTTDLPAVRETKVAKPNDKAPESGSDGALKTDVTPGCSIPESLNHPPLYRQEGRLSFYKPAENRAEEWKNYLVQLDGAVEQFHQQCLDLCKKMPGTRGDGFTNLWNNLAQIEEMDCHMFTTEAGRTNVSKNRYRDILPWDHTRVHLATLENDYINASHVNMYCLTPLSPRYIATQGPIPQCFADFWTMVWEQGSVVIVMLTNEVEGNKLKCHPYWPRKLDQTAFYGKMAVTFTEQEAGPSWRGRTFILTQMETKEARFVKQLQFTAWPDYGIPETPLDLLSFLDEVQTAYLTGDKAMEHPLILHCSAGVGRTGTFCCVYSAMLEINGGNALVEIPAFIRKLRQCRAHMVQKKEQLVFCFQAILCYVQQFLATEQLKQQQSASSNLSCGDDDLFLPDVPETTISEKGDVDMVDRTEGKDHTHKEEELSEEDSKTKEQLTGQQSAISHQSCDDAKKVGDTRYKEEINKQHVQQKKDVSSSEDSLLDVSNSIDSSDDREGSMADSLPKTDIVDKILPLETKQENNKLLSSSGTVNSQINSSWDYDERSDNSDEGIADVVVKPRDADEEPSEDIRLS